MAGRGRGGIRIQGGVWRGRTLSAPPGARPTGGRVKEALFNIWSGRLEGATMLDLFAGSGAVGLEALGRGVDSVLLVERSERALRAIRAAIRQLDAGGAQAWRAELPRGLVPSTRVPGGPFDLVFADPPYDFAEFAALLAAIGDLVGRDARVAVEHSSRVDLPESAGALSVDTRRRYGESALTFFRPRPDRPRVG